MEYSGAISRGQIWLSPSFTFTKGCRLCIRAESGAGKSSLLSYIYGNRHDYLGSITFDNTDIRQLRSPDWSRLRCTSLALLPQEMRLFPELTVIQNIQLKNQLTDFKTEAEIKIWLDRLDILHKMDVAVGKLSIGQQQRVAFVRTLCQPFDFMFLDEPVSHLDERNNHIIAEIAEEEASGQGAGIVSTSVGNHLLLSGATFIDL